MAHLFHAPCAQLVTMGRYRGVGMPRPKKQKPTAIELLHTATVEMEQAAESASSASCAAELTSVLAPTATRSGPVPQGVELEEFVVAANRPPTRKPPAQRKKG